MTRPLIAVTARRIPAAAISTMDPRYTGVQVIMAFSDYASSIKQAGGIPVIIPYEATGAEVIARVDGLLVTGGQDLHPSTWDGSSALSGDIGRQSSNPNVYDIDRDEHELGLVRAALDAGLPVLGVCRGHQLLNVACGGTLIPDLLGEQTAHQSVEPAPHAGAPEHVVTFEEGSLSASIFGPRLVRNSWHHQAVDDLGAGLRATGRTPDGVVESIEMPGRPVLGVQWHPEWQTDVDPSFAWLVEAAQAATGRAHHLEMETQP